jgi:REP element-mobilizing transposase RayT
MFALINFYKPLKFNVMANTYHQIYIHAIFCVKYKAAILKKEWRPIILGALGNFINETGSKTIIVNGVEDHVHCLFGLNPTKSISELIKEIKSKSSKNINDNNLTPKHFEWQRGYGAFSYSRSQLDNIYNYILNQENHHKKQSFIEEYTEFLNKFDIPYDERYIFSPLI